MYTNTITHSKEPSVSKEAVKRRAFSLGKGIAGIMGILLAVSLVRNIQTLVNADQTINETTLKLEKLKKENSELQAEAQEAQQDYFLEKQARDKLGYAKEGEVSLVLPSDDILRRLAPKQASEEEESLPTAHWQKWLRLFF